MNGTHHAEDDEQIRSLIVQGKFGDARDLLRRTVRDKAEQDQGSVTKTPLLNWVADLSKESVEELFAMCAWEASSEAPEDLQILANDANLLEQAVTRTLGSARVLPFQTIAAWLSMKSRPGASRDELNDAQQLLDRYLRQAALDVDANKLRIDPKVQSKYAYLTELLVCRVLPSLGLIESSQSFLAKENIRKDLLREVDRARLTQMLATLSPQSSVPRMTRTPAAPLSPTAVSTATPVATSLSTNINPTSQRDPSLDTQNLVDEFKERQRQQQEEQAKMAMIAGASVAGMVLLSLLISERKRVGGIFSSFGDLLFGD